MSIKIYQDIYSSLAIKRKDLPLTFPFICLTFSYNKTPLSHSKTNANLMFSAAKPYDLLYIFDSLLLKYFLFQKHQHVILELKRTSIKQLLFS